MKGVNSVIPGEQHKELINKKVVADTNANKQQLGKTVRLDLIQWDYSPYGYENALLTI